MRARVRGGATWRRLALVATLALVMTALTACRQPPPPVPRPRPSAPATTAPVPSPPATRSARPSSAETDATRVLPPRSRRGDTLFALIVAAEPAKAAAEASTRRAEQALGEFETHFVAHRSDCFEGLPPGAWIVVEFYGSEENAEYALSDGGEWLRSAGFAPKVVRVTVRCDDDLPLVEDQAGGIEP